MFFITFMIISFLVLFLVIVIFYIHFMFIIITINGKSMEPALQQGERVLAVRYQQLIPVKKGSIVLLQDRRPEAAVPEAEQPPSYIKRVIALGGETVRGEELFQSGIYAQKSWTVPAGSVFVCGDNTATSFDSRQWGPLPLQWIQAIIIKKLPRRAPAPASVQPRRTISSADIGPACNTPAPPFTAQTLAGETVTLATYADQTVVFLFFSPSLHCSDAMAMANQLAPQASHAGIQLIAVSSAGKDPVTAFLKEVPLDIPILLASSYHSSFFYDYHMTLIPAYCLVRAGKVEAAGILNMNDAIWQTLVASWQSEGHFDK